MGGKSVLLGMGQIRRQQQEAVGAGLLGADGDLAGNRGAVSGARQHRHAAPGLVDGDRDDLRDFRRCQREELAGAAGSEQTRDLMAAQPVHVGAVGRFIERIIRLEGRDGKGQQPTADLAGHLLRGHFAHVAIPQVLEIGDAQCRVPRSIPRKSFDARPSQSLHRTIRVQHQCSRPPELASLLAISISDGSSGFS